VFAPETRQQAPSPTGTKTNATTQIKWGLGYIKQNYGSPCGAWSFEQKNGYY
jgi:hypothetical protein